MRDYFKSALINERASSYAEGIASNFVPISLSPPLQAFYEILFPLGSSHNYKLFLAANFIKIIESAGLEAGMKLDDSRVTFELKDEAYFYSDSVFVFDFDAFYQKLLMNKSIIDLMLNVKSRYTDTTYESYWRLHTNPIFKVAGLLIAYVNRIVYK